MSRDHFDEVLDQSAPYTSHITPEVASELQRLRADTAASPRRRGWGRPAVAGLAAVLMIGGSAAAAAAAGAWYFPWAENDSVASFTYTLPSGIECEQRVGGVTGDVQAVTDATENFFRSTDIQGLLTPEAIQRAIDHHRAGDEIHVNDDGTVVPGGYGTAFYSADREYATAVWDVVVTAMDDDLARQGLTGVDPSSTLQSEPRCPGADL